MYPALAVMRALGGRADVLWVGGEGGMEAALVHRSGIAFEAIPAAGVHGVGLRSLPGNLWRLARGTAAAAKVIRRFQPGALFFTGGYVAVPVAVAGWRLPKAVYVPDVEPGLALRVLARMADVVMVTTEASLRYYPPSRKAVVTGYPTRPELEGLVKEQARQHLGLPASGPVLLVFGGSRGARSINRALWGCLPAILERAHVVHITGELDWPEVEHLQGQVALGLAERYHPHAYLHEDMAAALAAADLAVSRAGASTLGEFPLFGLPAVLVPYPHAWRYQRVNADYLTANGAAVCLNDEDLPEKLAPAVLQLLGDSGRLASMAAAARRLARPSAAQAIASEILGLLQTQGGRRD